MKKSMALALLLMFACASVFAMSPQEEKKARYNEIKKIKDAQRAERDAEEGNNPSGVKGNREPGFWDREAERSGISGARMGNWFKNLNPVPFFKSKQDQYKERKAASEAGHASARAQAQASPQSAVAATT